MYPQFIFLSLPHVSPAYTTGPTHMPLAYIIMIPIQCLQFILLSLPYVAPAYTTLYNNIPPAYNTLHVPPVYTIVLTPCASSLYYCPYPCPSSLYHSLLHVPQAYTTVPTPCPSSL